MKKVRLGRTNLYLKQLGWGGIPIQGVNEQEAASVIRSAIDMGVELFDTARGYTNSEYKLGLALQTIDKPAVLSSKSHLRTEKIEREVLTSLEQMKVRKIHIYHLHAINRFEEYDEVVRAGGAYEGLQRMRDRGLIDHIGISR